MKTLKLADGLELPAATAATQVYAFMGRRGSGKTYGAGRLVEQLYEHGYQFCVVDPVGNWGLGLRLAADGKKPGLDVPVFGGPHGDLPLPASAGKVLADMVASRSSSVVLDVSGMTITEQRRFVGEFAAELFQAKKRNKSPLLVVFEECQEFVPQHVLGEAAKMVSAMQRLIKLGRNYGIGAALVSQRPQAVNKDALNQTELMLAFQLTGPQERKAIAGWVQEVGAGDREIADELPGLKTGHAICWSPSWLTHFGRHKILPKWTYDASATPERREAEASKTLPAIDLEELRQALAESEIEVVTNDPKALQAEVARLRAELARAGKAAVKATHVVRLEAPPELLRMLAAIGKKATRLASDLERATQSAHELGQAAGTAGAARPAPAATTPDKGRPAASPVRMKVATTNGTGGSSASVLTVMSNAGAPARMLRALASRHPEACSKRQIATLAGVPVRTSTFRNGLSILATRGLAERLADDMLRLTEAGLAAAGGAQTPESAAELLAMWRSRLTGKAKDMLDLFAAEPETFTKAELAKRIGIDPATSTFRNYLSELRSNDLIRQTLGGFVINPELAL